MNNLSNHLASLRCKAISMRQKLAALPIALMGLENPPHAAFDLSLIIILYNTRGIVDIGTYLRPRGFQCFQKPHIYLRKIAGLLVEVGFCVDCYDVVVTVCCHLFIFLISLKPSNVRTDKVNPPCRGDSELSAPTTCLEVLSRCGPPSSSQ